MKKFYLKNCCFLTVLLILCSFGIKAQIYVDASRPDDSGDGLSLGTAKRTIQAGVNTASASTVIIIAAGTYDELVVIDKPLTIEGVDKNTCTLKYTGGAVSGGTTPTLFKVTAQNVTIKNLSMDVDLAKIWSAIITSGDASGLKILNNKITATRSANTNAASYTDQNAIGANISGRTIPGVTNASNNLGVITVQGTEIAYSLPGIYNVAAFRAGITADNYSLLVGGDNISDGNIIQTINHDVTNRFQTSATQTILKNNTFKGGGIEFSEPNAPFAGAVIVNNTFDYTLGGYPSFALVRFKNNDNNKPFQFKGNTVKNNYWLMSLENFQNIEIDGNTFSPIPNLVNTFKILTVNTKTISSSVNTKLPISAKIVNNTFNGVPLSVNSKALAFYNHDNASPQFGSFVIGETGKPNIFNTDISHYIYLDNDNANLSKDAGNTAMAGYPEYGGNITQTITANWDKNIKADQNQFFVDGQMRVPFDMTLSQRAELDGKIFDKKDDTNIGEVQYYLPVKNVTTDENYATIQEAIDGATAGDEIKVLAGTYAEKITISKQLTIKGPNIGKIGTAADRVAEAKIVPHIVDLSGNSASLVLFSAGSDGSTFDGFEVNGNNPALTSNKVVNGEDIDTPFGIGIEDAGNITVQNNIVKNYNSTETTPFPWSYGIYASPNSSTVYSGIIIKNNYVSNIQTDASAAFIGILASDNAYAQISHNKIEDVRTGVQINNAHAANPNAATFQAYIDNNEIIAARGVYYNLAYQTASPWFVRNNTISSSSLVGTSSTFTGIKIESIQNTYSGEISGNSIDGLYNARHTENVNFDGTGIWFNNNVNTTGSLLVKNNNITNVNNGIVYNASGSSQLTANVRFVGGNIYNVTDNYVKYNIESGTPTFADIDLPSTQLDGKTGEEHYDIAGNLNSIYAKIIDKDDNQLFGKVNLLFPIQNITQGTAYTTLQEANDDALTLDTDLISIKNDPGIYENLGDITLTKSNTIGVTGNTSAILKFTNFTANAPNKEITLNNPVQVNGAFTLEAGKITPSGGFQLNGLVLTTNDIANFINGAVTVNNVNTSADLLIPVGKGNKAAYIALTGISGTTTSSFTAEYFPSAYGNLATEASLPHVSSNEYWSLNRNSGDLAAKVKLYTFDLNASGLQDIPLTEAVVSWFNTGSSKWETQGNSVSSSTSPQYVIASIDNPTFGNFTFGSTLSPLPVSLTSFTAKATTEGALINWSTAMELSNDKFIIEKSLDGKTFFKLTEVQAKGSGNYSYLDRTLGNSAYYRLVQVDLNKKTTVFNDMVRYVSNTNENINVYPNPTTSFVNINLDTNAYNIVSVKVTDALGKQINNITEIGSQSIKIDLQNQKTGIYFIQLTKNNDISYYKVVKQ